MTAPRQQAKDGAPEIPDPADIDLTPEERVAMLRVATDVVAKAIVRWVARKAKEAARNPE